MNVSFRSYQGKAFAISLNHVLGAIGQICCLIRLDFEEKKLSRLKSFILEKYCLN